MPKGTVGSSLCFLASVICGVMLSLQMKRQRYIEKDGLIVTRFGKEHTYNDAAEALDELLKINLGKNEIYEIVINDDDLKLNFSRDEIDLLVEKVESTFGRFEHGALAIVAGRDFAFGMSRMLQMSIANEKIAVSVFRSEELARKWIQEIKAMHNE